MQMNAKKFLPIMLATAGLSFGQLKMPKLSDMKDKLSQKNSAPAKVNAEAPAAGTAAPVTGQPTQPQAAAESKITPLPAGSTKGQMGTQGMELTMCEKPGRDPQSRWDVLCTKAARTFEYKGSVTNVFGILRFTPALTNESVRLKVNVFKNGTLDEYREITFQTGGRTAGFSFTKTPGAYVLKVVDQYDDDKVALTENFVVMPDTVGDRATRNIQSGIGKLMVCSTIDDNWKCVDESTTWTANKPFNLYVRLPQAIEGTVAGWSIFKQNPDGTDGLFVEDLLQGTNGRAAYWATTNGNRLPAGKYTIYSIAWANRATVGNLTQYFAKTTLTVK